MSLIQPHSQRHLHRNDGASFTAPEWHQPGIQLNLTCLKQFLSEIGNCDSCYTLAARDPSQPRQDMHNGGHGTGGNPLYRGSLEKTTLFPWEYRAEECLACHPTCLSACLICSQNFVSGLDLPCFDATQSSFPRSVQIPHLVSRLIDLV